MLHGKIGMASKAAGAPKPAAAEALATLPQRRETVTRIFSGRKTIRPIQRVNVDFTANMLRELDDAAQELNISRQAVIKSLLRQALNQNYLAHKAR